MPARRWVQSSGAVPSGHCGTSYLRQGRRRRAKAAQDGVNQRPCIGRCMAKLRKLRAAVGRGIRTLQWRLRGATKSAWASSAPCIPGTRTGTCAGKRAAGPAKAPADLCPADASHRGRSGCRPCRSAWKTKNGRKNVKSAPYRPLLSEDRRRQRPTHVYPPPRRSSSIRSKWSKNDVEALNCTDRRSGCAAPAPGRRTRF